MRYSSGINVRIKTCNPNNGVVFVIILLFCMDCCVQHIDESYSESYVPMCCDKVLEIVTFSRAN